MADGQKKAPKKSKPTDQVFSDEEKQAMRELVRERKAGASREEGERDVQAKIAEMPETDRRMAERLHTLILTTAPILVPKTWYGMPAYTKDGQIICFFQCADKFKARYATLGFSDKANLDDGGMWPSSFALKSLTATEEAQIAALIKRAVG